MSFDKAVRRLEKRDWSVIKSCWLEGFDDYEDIGCSPSTPAQTLLETNSSLLILEGTAKEKTIEIPGVRNIVLRESMFLAHKSSSFLRSFNRDLISKQPTNAEISAYTGSFLLAKAIILLLGVWFTFKQINSSEWLVDLFKIGKKSISVNIISCGGKQLGHKEVWSILMRLFRTAENSPLDGGLISFVGGLQSNSIARTRNRIQYDNCEWLYDDLLHDQEGDISWLRGFKDDLYHFLDPDEEDNHFNVVFYFMMFRAYCSLLKDLSKGVPALEHEYGLLMRNIEQCDERLCADSWVG